MESQTLCSPSVPNCRVADGAVSPRVCLEKAADGRKGETVFYLNKPPAFMQCVIKQLCWDQNHFTFLKGDSLGLGLSLGNSLDQRLGKGIPK